MSHVIKQTLWPASYPAFETTSCYDRGLIELVAGFLDLIYAGILFFGLWISGAIAGGFSVVAGFFNGLIVGGLELFIALLTLAVGFGLLSGRGWAWEFAVFISIINIIVGFIQLSGAAVSIVHLGIVGEEDSPALEQS